MKRISSYQKTCLYIFGCIALMIWATAAADSKPNVSTSIQSASGRKFVQINPPPKYKRKRKGKGKPKMVEPKIISVPPGNWGATGINVAVEAASVRIEYDCADGEINQKFITDEKGNFSLSGFHTRLYPGAIRVDLLPKPQPARYQGKIAGETMRLKVTLTESGDVIGEFTLERDQTGRIRKCY